MSIEVPIFPVATTAANGFLIEDADSGVLRWFSIKEAKAVGATHGWTDDVGKALQFGRRQDAEDFVSHYLVGFPVRIAGRRV